LHNFCNAGGVIVFGKLSKGNISIILMVYETRPRLGAAYKTQAGNDHFNTRYFSNQILLAKTILEQKNNAFLSYTARQYIRQNAVGRRFERYNRHVAPRHVQGIIISVYFRQREITVF
jgi:hypothetical protein